MSTIRKYPQALHIPYDIVEEVFKTALRQCDEEGTSRIPIFKSFSLVSRDFLVSCQKHIFRRYTHRRRMNNEVCYTILLQNPHLACYVQDVHIDLGYADRDDPNWWRIFRFLWFIKNLEISCRPQCKWSSLKYRTQTAVLDLLRRPGIATLTLRGIENPPIALVRNFIFIKHLRIEASNSPEQNLPADDEDEDETSDDEEAGDHGISDDEEDRSNEDSSDEDLDFDLNLLSFLSPQAIISPSNPIRLESLILDDSDYVLHIILSQSFWDFTGYPFDFANLNTLRVDLTPKNLLPSWFLIIAVKETLIDLDIRHRSISRCQTDPFGFDYNFEDGVGNMYQLPEVVSLEPLRRLRTLSITILIEDYMQNHINMLWTWCSLLRTAPHGITTLHITLDAFYLIHVNRLTEWFGGGQKNWSESDSDDSDNSGTDTPDANFLAALDEILSNATHFPSLQCVSILVVLPDNDQSQLTDDEVPENITAEEIAIYETVCEDVLHEGSPQSRSEELDDQLQDLWNSNSDLEWSAHYSKPYPLEPCEVEATVHNMLPLTEHRFQFGGSFLVDVEYGHYL